MRASNPPSRSVRRSSSPATSERLGYHRFWVAEHHAIGGVASTAPEVLIGHIADGTERIRVGSGGMLLPNHRPLHVAEQFLMLSALHPGTDRSRHRPLGGDARRRDRARPRPAVGDGPRRRLRGAARSAAGVRRSGAVARRRPARRGQGGTTGGAVPAGVHARVEPRLGPHRRAARAALRVRRLLQSRHRPRGAASVSQRVRARPPRRSAVRDPRSQGGRRRGRRARPTRWRCRGTSPGCAGGPAGPGR